MYQCYLIMGLGFLVLCAIIGRSLRREHRNHLIFSPFLLFCLFETAMVWPAVIFARLTGVSQDAYAALVVVSSTVAFAVGYFVLREAKGWAHAPFQLWSSPMRQPVDRGHLITIVACTVLFAAGGLYLFRGLPPAVSGLQQVFTGDYGLGVAEQVGSRRLELTKGHFFGGEYRGQGVVRAFMRIGWPYLTAIAALLFLRQRRCCWFIASAALLAACFVFIAGDGTRGPFLWAMISLLVTVSYQVRLRPRTCVGVAILLVGILMVLSLPKKLSRAIESGNLWSEGVPQLAERIFVGNGIHTIHTIEFVRSGEMELRWGAIHANDIAASLPFVSSGTPFFYELFLLQNPDATAGQTTFANTTYLGIVYAEFGWLGCVLGYFLLGGLTARVSEKLFRRPKTVTGTAFVGMVAMFVGQINLWGSVYCAVSIGVLFFIAELYQVILTSSWTRCPSQSAAPAALGCPAR